MPIVLNWSRFLMSVKKKSRLYYLGRGWSLLPCLIGPQTPEAQRPARGWDCHLFLSTSASRTVFIAGWSSIRTPQPFQRGEGHTLLARRSEGHCEACVRSREVIRVLGCNSDPCDLAWRKWWSSVECIDGEEEKMIMEWWGKGIYWRPLKGKMLMGYWLGGRLWRKTKENNGEWREFIGAL